jgi:hypothetical protein
MPKIHAARWVQPRSMWRCRSNGNNKQKCPGDKLISSYVLLAEDGNRRTGVLHTAGGRQHEPRAVRIYNLQDRGVEPCQSWHDSKRAGRLTHSRATAPTACKPVVDGQDGQRQPYHCFSYVTSIHFTAEGSRGATSYASTNTAESE